MTDTVASRLPADRADASPVAAGLSAAGRAAPASLLASLPGLVFLAGYDHLAYGLGLLAGLVLAGLLVAPRVAGFAPTITDALDARFGHPASLPAAIVLALVVLPLLAAELGLVGTFAEISWGLPYVAAVLGACAVSALGAFLLGERTFGWLTALAFLLFVTSLFVPIAYLAAQDPGSLWPHEAHGLALDQIRALEEKMIEAGQVDFDTFSAHVTPFGHLERLHVLALVASLALGTAVMPPLLAALVASGTPHRRRLAGAWTALFVAIVVLAVPLLVAFAKLALYKAMTSDIPLTNLPVWLDAPLAAGLAHIHGTSTAMIDIAAKAIASGGADASHIADQMTLHSAALGAKWTALPDEVREAIVGTAQNLSGGGKSTWQLYQSGVAPVAARAAGNETALLTQGSLAFDPLGFWLALPALANVPPHWALLVAAGPVAAALVMAAALMRSLRALSTSIGGRPGRPPAAVLAMLLVAIAVTAAAAAMVRLADDLVPLVTASLSLAAAGLFPVLAVGLAWKRATAMAAAAAIVFGAGVTLYYDIGIQVFPAAFYETWPGLSNAGEYAIEEFASRKEAVSAAEDDAAREAAKEALDAWARGTPSRPGLANWFGIESSLGAVFGVPIGFAVLVVVTFVTAPFRRKTDQP